MRAIFWGIMLVVLVGCAGQAGEQADAGQDTDSETELADGGADAGVDTEGQDAAVPDEEYCQTVLGEYKRCEGDLIVTGEGTEWSWQDGWGDCTHITGKVDFSGNSGNSDGVIPLPYLACVDGAEGIRISGGEQYVTLSSLKRASRVVVIGNQFLTKFYFSEVFEQMPGDDRRVWFEGNDHFPTCDAVEIYNRMHDAVGCIDSGWISDNMADECSDESGLFQEDC